MILVNMQMCLSREVTFDLQFWQQCVANFQLHILKQNRFILYPGRCTALSSLSNVLLKAIDPVYIRIFTTKPGQT